MEHTVTTDFVKATYARLASRGPKDAFMGLRTEVHEALQAQLPPPYSDHPAHLPKEDGRKFTAAEQAEIHEFMRSSVTDAEIIAFDRARAKDRDHRLTQDAHHFVQKEHGKALWAEADRLIKAAGITEAGAQ